MAVYTEVGDEDLVRFVAEYDIGEVVSCKGIAEGIENSNFALATAAGAYVLTLYEKRVKPDDLPYFLGLMEHLAAGGIPCPVPVHGRDGEALRTLSGRPAAIVTFLPGMWPRRIQPEHCAEVGRALAELHLAGPGFRMRRDNDWGVAAWRPLLARSGAGAEEVEDGLADELSAALDALEGGWPEGLAAGVIHADLFPDNVFFRGGQLSGMIDFYFACNDTFAYDLAVCLNAWCFEPDHSFNITKARRMLTAYRRVRAFPADELAALPLLAQGAAMRFLLTRLYDWLNRPDDALVTPKDPREFLAKLRFHRAVRGPGEYGLD